MAYRFLPDDESVEAGLRRIATEQIDKAIGSTRSAGEDRAGAIHDVRKRCKKLRGLIRLVRPAFDDYKAENAFFRDTSRILGGLRDARVMLGTYDLIAEAFDGRIDRRATASIRRRFTERRKALRDEARVGDKLARCRDRLFEARERVDRWELGESGWGAVNAGLLKTYGRARDAMEAAIDRPNGERHHEWRKRVKYHWYHARLLEGIWPEQMEVRAEQAHELSSILGDHHDLVLFEQRIAEAPGQFGSEAETGLMMSLARRLRADLESEAEALGARLLAEPEKALGKRWGAWWKAWADEPDTALAG